MSNIYQLLAKKRGKMVMYLTAGIDAIHATLIPAMLFEGWSAVALRVILGIRRVGYS